ncbi:Ig-like domain-containing protein [Colwelliaceae bacterium BS250]
MFNKNKFLCFFYSFALLVLTACSGDNSGFPKSECGGDANPCTAYPVELLITPENIQVSANTSFSYRAIAIFSDESQQDVTENTSWESSDITVATITSLGLATTDKTGVINVSAVFAPKVAGQSSVSAQTTLTVSEASLVALELSPFQYEALIGLTVAYQAVAIYDDGYQLDITQLAEWQSDDELIAQVSNNVTTKGQAIANAVGKTNIKVKFAQLTNEAQLLVLDVEPVKMVISPGNAQVPLDTSVQYQAHVLLADDRAIDVTLYTDWTLDNSNLGTFNKTDVFTGTQQGQTNVNAEFTYGNISFTESQPVTVTAPQVQRLLILPQNESFPSGSQGRYQALAYFSDGQVVDVTENSLWQLSDDIGVIVASGENSGFATANNVGQSKVSAQFSGLTSETSVTVTQAVIVELVIIPVNYTTPAGTQLTYHATARFSDQSTQDASELGIWNSSDATIANIGTTGTFAGVANAVAPGETQICIDYLELSACTELAVTSAIVTALQITPVNVQVPLGTDGQYQATAFFSDDTRQDVTAIASWSSANESITSIIPKGIFAGYARSNSLGNTTITASYDGVQSTTEITITDAELSQLIISPVNVSLAAGNSQAFTVYGLYTDSSSKNLTNQANWQGSDDSIAYVNQQGIAKSATAGEITVMATVQDKQISAKLTVTSAELTRIAVTPQRISVAAGNDRQLLATAYFSDLTTRNITNELTWYSDDAAVATVVANGMQGGLVSGIAFGTTKVTASFQDMTDTAFIEVTAALLDKVTISPKTSTAPVGINQQFELTAIFSDNTTLNVTNAASWQSLQPNDATVNNQGLVTTHNTAVVTVSGNYQGLSDSAMLTITEAIITDVQVSPLSVTVPKGTNGHFIATAFYSDGQTSDVTQQALWQSNDNSIVSVIAIGINAGDGYAQNVGSTQVSATFSGLTRASEVTISDAVLKELKLTPEQDASYVGGNTQYTVFGVFSDDTSKDLTLDVSWSSTAPQIASVSQQGLVTGGSVGDVIITASFVGKTSNNGYLTISEAIVERLVVHPSVQSVAKGQKVEFLAHAYFSDDSNKNVTNSASWTANDSEIASHNSNGVFQTLATGITDISAAYKGKSSTGNLEVTGAILEQLTIAPIMATIVLDETINFQAFGIFSDQSSQDLSNDVFWQIDDAIASIDSVGKVTGAIVGQTLVRASLQGQMVEATLTVNEKDISYISVVPIVKVSNIGDNIQYVARAIHPDSSTTEISQLATWLSSNPEKADIITAGENGGLATAKSTGLTSITANYKGKSGSSELEVLRPDPVITELLIEPSNIDIIINTQEQLTAFAIYDNDMSTRTDVTDATQWSFDDDSFAVFSTPGKVVATAVGSTFIVASYQGKTQRTALNVRDDTVETITVSPNSVKVPVNSKGRFTAMANYISGISEDVTEQATWSSLKPDIVHLVTSGENGGQATAISVGSTPISANFKGKSDSVFVTVLGPDILSVYIEPQIIELEEGQRIEVKAYAEIANESPLDITADGDWISDDIAQISGAGSSNVYLNGISAGDTTLIFSYQSMQAQASVKVTSLKLESIQITPDYFVAPQDFNIDYIAIGHYEGGVTRDITELVTWGVDDTDIANISEQGGIMITKNIGETRVFATLNNITADTYIEVSYFALYRIIIEPDPIIMQVGQTLQFKCTAVYRLIDDDEFKQTFDITDSAGWKLNFSSPVGGFIGQGLFEATATGGNEVNCLIDNGDGSSTFGKAKITVN